MFRLNAPVVIRAKMKCETTLLFIAMHYTEDTRHWRSKVGEDCSSLPASSSQQSMQQPGTSSPPSRLKRSSPQVSSGCARPPSPTTPVLCHCPVWWSPPSYWIGWWCSHACSATADFSIIPLSQASRCSFSLVSMQSPFGLSDVDLAAAAGDTIWIVTYPSLWSTSNRESAWT